MVSTMSLCPTFQSMSPWSALQVRADRIPRQTLTCNTLTQDCTPCKRSESSSAALRLHMMHSVSMTCTSHLIIFKSFQPHLYLNVVNNDLEGEASLRWCSKSFARPRKATFAFRKHFTVASMRARNDPHKRRPSSLRREHVLQKAQRASHASSNADLCYPDKASFEKGDREGRPWSTAMQCRSIGHTSRSLHPSVRSNSKFLRRLIR